MVTSLATGIYHLLLSKQGYVSGTLAPSNDILAELNYLSSERVIRKVERTTNLANESLVNRCQSCGAVMGPKWPVGNATLVKIPWCKQCLVL